MTLAVHPSCSPQDGLHFTVDCGKDLFTATTQNWGKTRMVSLEELARPDRCVNIPPARACR